MYEKAVKNSADLVVAGYKRENDRKKGSFVFFVPHKSKDVLYGKKDFLILSAREITKKYGMDTINVWDKLYKRSLLKEIRFNSSYDSYEDRFFNLDIYEKAENVLVTPFVAFTHYCIDTSAGRDKTKLQRSIKLILNYIETLYTFYEKNGLSKYKKYIDKWAAQIVYHRIRNIIANCEPDDPLVKEVATNFRRKYILRVGNPCFFPVMLLFYLKQYRFLFGLYSAWRPFKQSIKKILGH